MAESETNVSFEGTPHDQRNKATKYNLSNLPPSQIPLPSDSSDEDSHTQLKVDRMKKQSPKSPRFMKPVLETEMDSSNNRMRPQRIILTRERTVRKFYGDENELKGFEEDLHRRWEDDLDCTLQDMVQDIYDNIGPEVKEELQMHEGSHRQDPYDLLRLLSRLYGCKKSISNRMAEFYSCHQGMNETVLAYSRRLHKIAEGVRHRQRLENMVSLEDSMERDIFVQGLTDNTLKKRLRESIYRGVSQTFLDIRNEAVRWADDGEDVMVTAAPARAQVSSSLKTSTQAAALTPTDELVSKIREGVATEVRTLREEFKADTAALSERIERLETRMNQGRGENAFIRGRGMAQMRGGFRGAGARGRGYRQRRLPTPNDRCHRCGLFGHFGYQCQNPGNGQPQ